MVPSINEPSRRIDRRRFWQVQRYRAEFTSHVDTAARSAQSLSAIQGDTESCKATARIRFTIFDTLALHTLASLPQVAAIHRDREAPVAPPRGFVSDIKVTWETEYCAYTLLRLVHIDFMSATFDHCNLRPRYRVISRERGPREQESCDVGSRSSPAPYGETSEAQSLGLAPCGRVRNDSGFAQM